ncbi:MAG: energy-coupling factor transporter transmembrane component T, partial [Vicingaceae bacterium]|nr:energy-coupling factor transporter transmembrane component T [Vicingaceae bacterium]
ILFISICIFVFNNVYIVLGLLALQIILWLAFQIPIKKLKPLKRIRTFLLVLVFFYTFFHGSTDFVLLAIKKWKFGISYSGFYAGLFMASKLLTMLLATFVVRFTTSSQEFMTGLKSLGLSNDFSLIIDGILKTVESQPKKKNKSDNKKGGSISVKSVLKGNFSEITDLINSKLEEARANFANNDIAIISAFSLIVTLIRFMKITPGFPIAPGHKNALIIPFFILASRLTNKKFAGTSIGFLSGVIHFMSGFGKYGPLGILQFALLGFVVDLFMLLFKKSNSIVLFCIIGLVGGFTRVSAEIGLAWLLRMPVEYYLFYLPYVTSQCLFGAASGIVTKYLIKKIK